MVAGLDMLSRLYLGTCGETGHTGTLRHMATALQSEHIQNRALFSAYLLGAQRAHRPSLSVRDVAASIADPLRRSELLARDWYRRIINCSRRSLTQREIRVLADGLGLEFEAVRQEAERAGL